MALLDTTSFAPIESEEERRRRLAARAERERQIASGEYTADLNFSPTRAPRPRPITYTDPVLSKAGGVISSQLESDLTKPDAITQARLSEFQAQQEKRGKQIREDLNRLNILRGGGATSDVLGEFTGQFERGAQDIKAQGITRRMNAVQQAMNFAQVGQAGTRLAEDVFIRERAQEEVERAAREREKQAAGALTGTLDGMSTLDKQRITEQIRAAKKREEQAQTALLGETDAGKITEARRAAEASEDISRTELDIRERTALEGLRIEDLNAKVQRAATEAGVTGQWVDPDTGLTRESLEAELRRRQQTETERATRAGEALQTGALVGEVGGVQTLAAQQTAAEIDLGERAMNIQESDQKFRQWKEVGTLTGELALLDGQGNAIMKADGNPMTIATLAAQDLALREGQAVGKVGDDPTVQQQALDLEDQIQRGHLALQQSAQAHGFNVDEAVLTGTYKSMGAAETGNFMTSYGKSSEETGYNARYDFNGDGSIDQVDWMEFQRISDGEGAETLNGQKVAQDVAYSKWQETRERAGLTGRLGELQTTQESQRLFDNMITDANTFVDVMPVSFTLGDFKSAVGSRKGDANFRAELDIDGDNRITSNDYAMMMSSDRARSIDGAEVKYDDALKMWEYGAMEKAMGASKGQVNYNERYDLNKDNKIDFSDFVTFAQTAVSESLEKGFVYQPEGKRTALSARLGIEEKQLTESVRQMDEQIDNARSQWMSMFSGVQVDENGQPQYVYDAGTQEWRQPTSMEREAHDQNTKIFDDRMEQNAGSLAGRLGLIPDDPDAVMVAWRDLYPGNLQEGAEQALNAKIIESLRSRGVPATPENVQPARLAFMQSALLNQLPEEQRVGVADTMAQVMFGSQYNVQYTPESGIGAAVAQGLGTAVGGLAAISDRNLKTDIHEASFGGDVLAILNDLPVPAWRYLNSDALHVGPMAQDFKAAFGLGDSDKEIQAVDAFGVLLMAVKALSEEVEQLKRERG